MTPDRVKKALDLIEKTLAYLVTPEEAKPRYNKPMSEHAKTVRGGLIGLQNIRALIEKHYTEE